LQAKQRPVRKRSAELDSGVIARMFAWRNIRELPARSAPACAWVAVWRVIRNELPYGIVNQYRCALRKQQCRDGPYNRLYLVQLVVLVCRFSSVPSLPKLTCSMECTHLVLASSLFALSAWSCASLNLLFPPLARLMVTRPSADFAWSNRRYWGGCQLRTTDDPGDRSRVEVTALSLVVACAVHSRKSFNRMRLDSGIGIA